MASARALFVWLISHDRKYCWLIYCERKTLLNAPLSLSLFDNLTVEHLLAPTPHRLPARRHGGCGG